MKYNYYKSELNRLKDSTENYKAVMFNDGKGERTHYLNLNQESIPIIIKSLEKELKRLKKLKF